VFSIFLKIVGFSLFTEIKRGVKDFFYPVKIKIFKKGLLKGGYVK